MTKEYKSVILIFLSHKFETWSPVVSKEHGSSAKEKMVLSNIFLNEKKEVR
jgi:hypothetical protein